MSRVRRFALLAVLTLCGGIALTACQSAPGLAVVVGDVRLTNAQVDEIVNEIDRDVAASQQKLAQASPSPAPGESAAAEAVGLPAEVYGNLRQEIVQLTIFKELARQYAVANSLTLPAQDYGSAAARYQISPDNPYITLAVDAAGYRQLLMSAAKPATPTEDDFREVYRRALAADALQPGTTYEQLRPELDSIEEIKVGIWLRDELAPIAERIGISVNPRYRPLEIATGVLTSQQGGQGLTLVALELEAPGGSPAVRDQG